MELEIPDSTAVRTALWRALHVQLDPHPLILNDTVGFRLIAPSEEWRNRRDMDPEFTKRVRLSIVTRARFVEDLLEEKIKEGITQYIILGAGLDSFAQRKPELASRLKIFEIDDPETLKWKQHRLQELGLVSPPGLHFVPVDFENEDLWINKLPQYGFDIKQPVFVACTGVSLYLSREAILHLFRQLNMLTARSVFAMTFLLPMEELDEEDKALLRISMEGAERSGHPFLSFFTHEQMKALAYKGGFWNASVVSKNDLLKRYFADRTDGLQPASGEDFLIATT